MTSFEDLKKGCHYLLGVKFKNFSMTFQDLFKLFQDLLYQVKLEFLFFKNQFNNTNAILQSLLFGFTELAES